MLRIERVVAATLAGVIVSGAAAQDAVQWRVEDGGNGHWYRIDNTKRGWLGSRQAAEAAGGDLACIETAAENEFLLMATPEDPNDGVEDFVAWIGLIRDCSSCGWYWVSDPDAAIDWLNWAPGEPNYPSANHNGGEMYRSPHPLGGQWNNASINDLWPSIFEWSADCNGDGIVDYGQILDGTFADNDDNGVPDCCEGDCPGDLNLDNAVNSADLGLLIAAWNTDGSIVAGSDINGDGTVNAADLGLLIGAWGECGGCN